MKNKNLSIALLLAASSTAACVANAPPGGEITEADVTSALELDNGGLDTENEDAMFGDGAAFDGDRLENDRPYDDAMRTDTRIGDLEGRASATRRRVLLAWGRWPLDLTATNARNWSGSLTIDRGAIVVGRTLGFEDAGDEILPRVSPDRIDFRSVTRPHSDGMVLRVIDPDPTAGPNRLRYTSADGTIVRDLDLSRLDAGPVREDAGDGNRVVAVALRERDACDHGFLRGRWVALRENLGAYRGVITNADGEPTGHIRGIWGQRRNGEAVMFGKFIARDGSFRGLLVGTYEAGEWKARWITRDGDHGIAGGLYVDAPDLRGGVFKGRFAETSCAQ
jgi:hypothetical protein